MRMSGFVRVPVAALLGGLVVCGMLFSGCLQPATASRTAEAAPFAFEQHDIVTGPAKRQTVLTGFVLEGPVADLVVVNNDDHRLRVYAFDDGNWVARLDAKLRSGVRFVDMADIDGRDRLLTYGNGQLNWFDPESATERALLAVHSDFSPPQKDTLFHVDITRDLNGDDRDDLVVPDAHGFQVFVQQTDGTFAEPVKIGPASGRHRIYGADGYRYAPWDQGGRVHEIDYDQDGRGDLVFWNEDHFLVHLQDEHGLFARTGIPFTTAVPFDSDEIASLAGPEETRNRRSDHLLTGDMNGRVLHALTDVNGDGVGDMVIFSLQSSPGLEPLLGQAGRLLTMRSAYAVYFGKATAGGDTTFETQAGAVIRTDGIPFGMDRHDFDLDGQLDVMFTRMDVDLLEMPFLLLGAMLSGSVSMDLTFHRMDDGQYTARPSATRTVQAEVPAVETGGKGSYHPAVLIADVNGDKQADLLVGRSQKELRVFLGKPGPGLFSRRPQKVAVAMPTDEEYTWLADLNQDDMPDLLMHHPSTTKPHRVTMLIAQ